MAFCGKCGAQIEDGLEVCQTCANATNEGAVQADAPVAQAAPAPAASDNDAQVNKNMGILAYILCIPLFTGDYKKSPFVKFHTNQGVVLYIVSIAYSIISSIIQSAVRVPRYVYGIYYGRYTPGWLSFILGIGSLFVFILWIIGIVNASKGEKKPLPLIGGINIIK